ncbi:MAG: Fatty acyl-CoA reductase [Candidatus Anoxychlamydiales bacterium]|nr:Fatty acyl-CoA reductase [Candidatus Anoxychlamydiales bacterium]
MNFLKRFILIVLLIFTSKTITLNAIAVSKLDLNNKVVLITGASRGIGLATAKYLANKGFRVYATVRDANSLDTSKIKNVHFEILDVTDLQSIKKTIHKIMIKEGSIDVLINNAGFALGGSLENLSMEDIQEQMDVNLFGAIRMCQEVLPHMRRQKSGHIINISSEQGVYGLPYGSMYSASKAALEAMSEALSIELLPWRIDVSIVEPGPVSTDFSLKMGTREIENDPYKKICDYMESSHKQKNDREKLESHYQSAEDIAKFLCDVIDAQEPQLRYQTNRLSKGIVSMKLNDVSGEDYLRKMKTMIEDFQKRLIDTKK